MTAVTFSATNWLATFTALVTSLASSRTSIWIGWPSIPSGWAALNVFVVTFSKAVLVVVPKAAVAPVSGVETPSLIGPAGIGGYFDVPAVGPVVPPPVLFFGVVPQAALTSRP